MLRAIQALLRRRPYDDLMIACMPKSGSTLLSKLLQAATGLPEAYLADHGPQHEQNPTRRWLRRHARRSVVQQHFRATAQNVELLNFYGIRPIVQTRSLFDVLPSLHDHYEHEPVSLPCGMLAPGYQQMDYAERLDYLIAAHLPWYFNFYLSWFAAAEKIAILQVTYEALIADPANSLAAVLEFYGFDLDAAQIDAAIAQVGGANTRRNVGVAGRGMTLLRAEQRDAIRRQAAKFRLQLDEHGSLSPLPCAAPRAVASRRAAA